MTRPLQDTVAPVTGSSSGIGAAARRLAGEGAAVVLLARQSKYW